MVTRSVNNNLSDVLFGKTRQAILSLLYGRADEAFYLRQIVRITGIGLGPIQRDLKQLTDAGIILRELKGKQVYYQANNQSPIFNELKNIVRKTFGVADVIRQSLDTMADRISVAFIFGSVAGSTDNKASDIDVMVIGKITFDEISSAISKAEETIRREINPVTYPIAEFRQKMKKNHHFLKSVLEGDKVFIIGDDVELARLGK